MRATLELSWRFRLLSDASRIPAWILFDGRRSRQIGSSSLPGESLGRRGGDGGEGEGQVSTRMIHIAYYYSSKLSNYLGRAPRFALMDREARHVRAASRGGNRRARVPGFLWRISKRAERR